MSHLSSVAPSQRTQQQPSSSQKGPNRAELAHAKNPGKTKEERSRSPASGSASDQDELGDLDGASLVEEIKQCLRSGEPEVATRHLRKLRGRALGDVSNEVIKMVKSLRKCPEGMFMCV
jgi:hypothetical protein